MKIIQIQAMPDRLVALDDSGYVWWRTWNKKEWGQVVGPDGVIAVNPKDKPILPPATGAV